MTTNKVQITAGRISLILVSLVLVIGGIWFFVSRGTAEEAPKYRPHTVAKDTLRDIILTTGTVKPENKVEIKPPIAGRVENVLVSEGQNVRKGQVLAWMSSTERAALLDAASSKGAEELKKWQELYRSTPILAPINGMIIQRNVESGQTFTTTDAILVISDRLTVKAQIDETDIGHVKSKQPAQIILDAYPQEPMKARVDQIAYDSTTSSSVTTYIVDVLPEKTPDFMRSGMTANVTIETAVRADVLWVPIEAVQREGGKNFVLKPFEKGPPRSVEVQLGLNEGKRIEITEGVIEGETILVPIFKLNEAAKTGANPFGPPSPPRRR